MTDQEITKFVQSYVQALTSQNADALEQFYEANAEQASGGEPGKKLDKAARKQYFDERKKAFPDAVITASNIQPDAANNRVTYDWKITATHKGDFKGAAATNKKVDHGGTTTLEFGSTGKIARAVSYQDLASFTKKVGKQAP
jgi:steroid delta-isomerase-like uncharacterized protein